MDEFLIDDDILSGVSTNQTDSQARVGCMGPIRLADPVLVYQDPSCDKENPDPDPTSEKKKTIQIRPILKPGFLS